jgi:2-polyprenyl-3-methyl-5-hydroxy-6-metoxy-1,4-benzoquinol methylase
MNITSKERQKYSNVWTGVDNYADRSPGEMMLPLFIQMIGGRRHGHVLDAGCGSGKGAVALHREGFNVTLCDLTPDGITPDALQFPFFDAALWCMPSMRHDKFDLAYCCDVMEHIPTQFTALVAVELLKCAPQAFISLSNIPDQFGAWIGEPLHQTVQPFTWWRDMFREVARVVDARDLHDNSVFLLERKPWR